MGRVNSGAWSEAATKSSIESEVKIEQKSDESKNVKINANAEMSSAAVSDNIKMNVVFIL